MAFRCRVPARWLATFLATAIAPIATAQIWPASITATSVRPAPAFEARLGELVAVLTAPDSYDAFFSAGVKTTLPKDKFDTLRARLLEINGPVSVARIKQMATPWSGLVEVDYHDAIATMQLDVDPAAPHQVAGLVIKDVSRREKSIDDILASLRSLHGSTGFALARLATGAATPRTAHQSDRPFAIGSAFKLIILAELVRATNAGERKWDDLVKLDGSALPGGGYNLKPKGTPVSLRELATQMISISDNSATDILLKALGREKVEAMLPVLGVKDPPRNRPFLSTMEVFKLKGIEVNDLASRYLAQDEAGRRRMLDGEVANLPALMIRPSLFRDGKPARIDTLEWFLSPADLVRVMDWLRRNTEGPQGADARAILSSNPGIAPPAANKWQWVGYKGGSEPGVMNMTLLLQSKAGDWYVLTASWNDPAQPVEEARFAALISRAAELAAP